MLYFYQLSVYSKTYNKKFLLAIAKIVTKFNVKNRKSKNVNFCNDLSNTLKVFLKNADIHGNKGTIKERTQWD